MFESAGDWSQPLLYFCIFWATLVWDRTWLIRLISLFISILQLSRCNEATVSWTPRSTDLRFGHEHERNTSLLENKVVSHSAIGDHIAFQWQGDSMESIAVIKCASSYSFESFATFDRTCWGTSWSPPCRRKSHHRLAPLPFLQHHYIHVHVIK